MLISLASTRPCSRGCGDLSTYGMASERLGLLPLRLPPPLRRRSQGPRLFLAWAIHPRWRCRPDVLCRGHIDAKTDRLFPRGILARHRLTAGTAPTRAGSQRLRVFSLRHKRRCSAAKPEDIGVAGRDSIPFDVAAVSRGSRGHIACCHSHFRRIIVNLCERHYDCQSRPH